MSLQMQSFTQSIRLMDPINQQRIKQKKRILWPDYEVLSLVNSFAETSEKLQTDLDLSNLFMYCPFEENFVVKRSTIKDYLNMKEIFSQEFTHLALWVCKIQDSQKGRSNLAMESQENSRSLENRRQRSVQKVFKTASMKSSNQQIYVILSKRPIAIDQITKTSQKLSISVVPLSQQKFLWGGVLNFEEFESFQSEKKQDSGLFSNSGQNFGFKIDSKPVVGGSFRKSNGMIDKRQLRFSNYYNAKKQQQQQSSSAPTRKPKECNNRVQILPQHIRQHQEFLYIEIDLNNNTQLPEKNDSYNFVSLDIYGRHYRPKYGGVYEEESESESSQNQVDDKRGGLRKYKKLLREQIFVIYSMQFMEFNSYLQSQLNFEQSQDMRQISFRGSCLMFSAMKKLQLKSEGKDLGQEGKQKEEQKSLQKIKKQKATFKGQIMVEKSVHQRNTRIQANLYRLPDEQKLNLINPLHNNSLTDIEIIEVLPESIQDNMKNIEQITNKEQWLNHIRTIILKQLCKTFKKQKQHNPNQDKLIYIPVFNPEGFQPLRIGVRKCLLELLNPCIGKSTAKVSIQQGQLKENIQSNPKSTQSIDIRGKQKRQSIYVGKGHHSTQSIDPITMEFVDIDVFLTDKVYKRETVEGIVEFLEHLEEINSQDISEGDLINSFQIISVQQLRNILTFLKDVNQCSPCNSKVVKRIKLLIWLQLFTKLNSQTHSQLTQIKLIKEQTQSLLKECSTLTTQDPPKLIPNLAKRQLHIIQLIKEFHHNQNQNVERRQFFIDVFLYFWTELNNGDAVGNEMTDEQKQRQAGKQKQSVDGQEQKRKSFTKMLEQVFSEFFLMNSKILLSDYQLQLSSIFKTLQKNNNNHTQPKQQQQHLASSLLRCKLWKNILSSTIKNLSSFPIAIFLSDPLQPLENSYINEESNTEEQNDFLAGDKVNNCLFECSKLKRFIKRHFVRGHNFLQRQINQAADTDTAHMKLVTDLLHLCMRIKNTEITLTNKLNHNRNQSLDNNISNVIDLIKTQYTESLENNGSGIFFGFGHIVDRGPGKVLQEIARFGRNQQQRQVTEKIDNKNEILHNREQFSQYNTCYLIKHHSVQSLNENSESSTHQIRNTKSSLNSHQQKALSLLNTKESISLSKGKQRSEKYDFSLSFTQSTKRTQKEHQSLQSTISFWPAIDNNSNREIKQQNDSFSIDLLRTHLGIDYNSKENVRNINTERKLLNCYEVIVEVEITVGKIQQGNQKETINDLEKIVMKGCAVLMFENYNKLPITNNIISLQFSDKSLAYPILLTNIQKVNLKIHSRQLPILECALSFVNLRLGKYLKNLLSKSLLNKSSTQTSKKDKRKTIGGRFTEQLGKRRSVLQIEENMLYESSGKFNRREQNWQKSTLYDLPQVLLLNLLRVTKSYIQSQQTILNFIDQYYQRNQPLHNDYILYLSLRPTYLRLSTVLRHHSSNRTKYQQSKILKTLLQTKLKSSLSTAETDHIQKLFFIIPRISSVRPLRNVKDTIEQRDLLSKYMKDNSKMQSLQRKSQSIGKHTFAHKKIIQQAKQQRKEQAKQVQI